MAAKQKGNASQENNKSKKPSKKAPVKKKVAANPSNRTNKKPASKKPIPKNEAKPQSPVIPEDDLGLDDIAMEVNEDVVPVAKAEQPKEKPANPLQPKAAAASSVEEVKEIPKPQEESKTNEQSEEEEKRKGTNVVLIIVLLLVTSAAIYFLFFYEPKQEPVAPIEEKTEEPAVITPEPAPEKVQPEPEPAPEPVVELTTISAPTGRYYVVIGSFYDVDLAVDKGNEIVKNGTNAFLLEPTGSFKLHRVGINASDEWSEAASTLEGLKSTYGDNIWVLKY